MENGAVKKMSKLTLKAPHKDALKIARCFPDVKILDQYGETYFLKNLSYGRFLTERLWCESYQDRYVNFEQITIDLDKNQPCIYACMREGLKVEVEYNVRNGEMFYTETYDFSKYTPQIRFLKEANYKVEGGQVIKSIRIIGLEEMKGVKLS
jgi:hypothetical protein